MQYQGFLKLATKNLRIKSREEAPIPEKKHGLKLLSGQNTNSHLGNMLTRLTLGLPGRLEAGQRSKARLVQASLEGRVMFKDLSYGVRIKLLPYTNFYLEVYTTK